MMYDDGTDVEIEIAPDDQPAVWVDPEDALHDPSPEELALGDFLGRMIDIEDDSSDGSEWAGLTAEQIESLR